MKWYFIVLIAVGIGVILSLVCAYAAYELAFRGNCRIVSDPYGGLEAPSLAPYKEAMRRNIDRIVLQPYEEVRIKSHDGLTLIGRYYHKADGAPLQIQFHGYRSNPDRDFSGGGNECLDKGHNLLLVHQRAHGISEGRAIAFGVLERYDCLSWVNYAIERFGKDVRIFLFGISMGASTVLMASELDLPQNVVGIVADCPYSSPIEIITKVAGDMHLPGKLLAPFVRLGARVFGGFSLGRVGADTAVAKSRIKTLIIHGEADNFVPAYISEKIAAARQDVLRYTFAEAKHGLSYVVNRDEYMRIVDSFLEQCLGNGK